MKKFIIPCIILVFISLFISDIFFVFSFEGKARSDSSIQKEGEFIINGDEIIQIEKVVSPGSPFSDSAPRIDSEAASIVVAKKSSTCPTFPPEIWILLLVSFVLLIIFNLAYTFEKTQHIQWGWELFYLFLTLFVWFYFDKCKTNLWFPLYVIKLGLITYLGYLYLFEKYKRKA